MQTYDLFAPATLAERHALFARMRAEPGLCRVEPFGAYAAARYEDAAAILKDPQRFSSAALAAAGEPAWLGESNPSAHSLLSKDPPHHTRLRALISRAFGPSAMARLEAQVRGVSERLADDAVRRREVELVQSFTFMLPRDIIGGMLGLEPSTYTEFQRWSTCMGLLATATPAQHEAIRSTVREMKGYLTDVIKARRRQPGDDMVSDLLRAEVEGRQLTDDEVLSFLFLLLPAGMETTAQLLGNAVIHLAQHPEHLERARTDKEYLPRFIEEVLRYEAPFQLSFRLATQDVELSGTPIPAGSLVLGLPGSANRDERVFARPDEFLPGREKGSQHLSFGYGVHYCLGAHLARMEARLGLEALVSRVREIRPRSPEIRWLPGFMVHGPEVLPVELVPA